MAADSRSLHAAPHPGHGFDCMQFRNLSFATARLIRPQEYLDDLLKLGVSGGSGVLACQNRPVSAYSVATRVTSRRVIFGQRGSNVSYLNPQPITQGS